MKNLIYAISSGLLLALAWPTYGFPLLLFFAFVPLLYAEFKVRNSEKKFIKWKVFGLAYLSFFLWNLITTYWIYFSTAFGGAFAILVNSLLMAFVFMLYHIVAKRTGFSAASAFLISIWMVFEKLHLAWEFSWPWLNLGNAFSEFQNWVQWYEYTGTFGGTLWVWLGNIAVFKAVLLYKEFKDKSLIYRGIFKLSLLVLIPIGISYLLLSQVEEKGETMDVVILQPNINPYTEKYNTTDTRIGELLLKLSEEKVSDSTRLIVAPETVFADGTVLSNFEQSEAAFFSRQLINKYPQANFLSGISFYERFNDPAKVREQSNQIGPMDWYDDYNSAFLMNAEDIPQLYHKSKLVVGVENFPYQNILKPILGDVMIDLGGTVAMKTTQEDREAFVLNNQSFTGPIICYESVYGEYVTGYVENGADFLSIITNDAWWGNTQGHQQHLSYAKLRAIETRRDVVRSANTGISAFINQKGEVTKSLGYEKQGSIKSDIHLNSNKTFYVKHGDYLARVAQFLALFIFLFAVVKYKRNRPGI
ncbi:apolipoprotein N-acyltransferase [Salegentibacter mishustinae]|uniref:Apolipoprotein N-acyltransferase n=1 Tax=Salegentibacter mishustinae TaxID=270918 RepID=A0A0Q9Z8Q1_9FLAO|nr:apolipoprotein N-acyltransferase [Salegentibacter mishustinae]KRG28409.1 acyltransferase [Salegentibacter mishustinae]PNW22343.1 acyltransferase [Salegentibacter mishustinae]PZX67571.1 apolipoprotein N-acyltransferase [Salegentibacter mishustinae]